MRLRLAGVVATLALIGMPAQGRDAPEPELSAVAAAAVMIHGGKVREGSEALDAPLQSYRQRFAGETRDIYCASSAAHTLLYMGMAASAKRSAVAVTRGWCQALFVKGYALIDLGRLDEGQRYLEQAIAMSPSNAHYLNELGFVHQKRRDWPAALETYRRAVAGAALEEGAARVAEHGRALRGIGFVLVEQGKWEEAKQSYEEALRVDPKDVKSTNELRWIAENRPKTS